MLIVHMDYHKLPKKLLTIKILKWQEERKNLIIEFYQ